MVLNYRVLGLFLYIVAIKHFNYCLKRACKPIERYNFSKLSYKLYIVNVKGLKIYSALGYNPNSYGFWNMSILYLIPIFCFKPFLAYYKLFFIDCDDTLVLKYFLQFINCGF
jgi:hypothetical protein